MLVYDAVLIDWYYLIKKGRNYIKDVASRTTECAIRIMDGPYGKEGRNQKTR